jgi:WhiB family redox-sensing transcriptional regulator
MTRSLAEASLLDTGVGACVADPDRWMTAIDDQAKAVCRDCPRRWLCAREACEVPRAEAMWAGVLIPEAGRVGALTRFAGCGHWPSWAVIRSAVRDPASEEILATSVAKFTSGGSGSRMIGNDHPNRPAQPSCHALW